jgi:hypothetical protein
MDSRPRNPLTDLPTTWEEYQNMLFVNPQADPHIAFIYAVFENETSHIRYSQQKTTRNPPMLREDFNPHLTNVIPTVLSTYGHKNLIQGYQTPFEKTFDESNHQYCISTSWSLDMTESVIAFTEEIMAHATACQEAISQAGENDTKATLALLLPELDNIIARMIFMQAEAIAGKLLEALRAVRKQKIAYAELIITCEIDVPINNELFSLCEFDGSYQYISKDGNTSIPF